MTKQKETVLMALKAAGRTHPTADTLYLIAKGIMPSIAMGTVYRNLSQMCEEGQLRRLTVPGGPDRFDMDTGGHDHLVCIYCGKLTDVDSGSVFIPPTGIPEGVQLLETELILKCICADCVKKENNKN